MKRLRMTDKTSRAAGTERRRVPLRSELQEQMTELVEQQAAMSEVLRAIASSAQVAAHLRHDPRKGDAPLPSEAGRSDDLRG